LVQNRSIPNIQVMGMPMLEGEDEYAEKGSKDVVGGIGILYVKWREKREQKKLTKKETVKDNRTLGEKSLNLVSRSSEGEKR